MPTQLNPELIESMNALSDQLIEQRKQLKPPSSYPQRENVSQFKKALNGTLRVAVDGATLDTLDVSSAESGAILATTSANEVKLLDGSGALSETIPIDSRVSIAKFAPNSDKVAIFAFEGANAQVWDLRSKQKIYQVPGHSAKISDVSFPPLEGVIAVSSTDGQWSLHDYRRGTVLM